MRSLRDLRALATRPGLHYENGDAMNDTSKATRGVHSTCHRGEGVPQRVDPGWELSGALDHMYPIGDPKQERPFLLRQVTTPARSTTGRIGVVGTLSTSGPRSSAPSLVSRYDEGRIDGMTREAADVFLQDDAVRGRLRMAVR